MNGQPIGYWQRLWKALLGQDAIPTPVPDTTSLKPPAGEPHLAVAPPAIIPPAPAPEPPPKTEPGLAEALARVATLEMDVRDRDERIAAMQQEYAALKATQLRDDSAARRDEVQRLLKRLTGPLSNLMALCGRSQAGREVEVADLLDLVEVLTKELGRAGLEMIGQVGESCSFNLAWHQRLSGSSVHPDTPVVIQIPGFRFGETVLLKAMISTQDKT